MDFLMMLNNGARIVIEIDGRHHYADESPPGSGTYIASPRKYAEMASEDRRLRSSGYEVYRFGGYEFSDVDLATGKIGDKSQKTVIEFFDRLLKQHGVK
jgi:very-short-patch-repair endonuclease